MELAPPTWMTLHYLAEFADLDTLMSDAEGTRAPRLPDADGRTEGGMIAFWEGDAAYGQDDPDTPGSRHRLHLAEDGWRLEDSRSRRESRESGFAVEASPSRPSSSRSGRE